MKVNQADRKFTWMLAFLTAAVIAVTRAVTLSYNCDLHPDEYVFYVSTNSLLNAILNPGTGFTEVMEYPEGAYLFQLPFQLLGRVVSRLAGTEQDLQLWGRIAGVFYFTLATLLGLRIVARYLGKSRLAQVVYCGSMCFSLFFIEQSRYGTGDMISLMLLMLLLNLTAQGVSGGIRWRWLAAACFCCGAAGAVKYPLLVFVLIPVSTVLACSGAGKGKKALLVLGMAAVCIAGLLLFSPKAIGDPGYFLRVLQREGRSYVTQGSSHEAGGAANHLADMVLYTLLYSDFPLSPVFAAAAFARGLRRGRAAGQDGAAFLFDVAVPAVCIFFFTYNLFARILFFRTYTPYFGIAVLYCAQPVAAFCGNGRGKRMAVAVLSAVMVVRGAFLVGVLSAQDAFRQSFSGKIAAAVDGNWEKTTLMPMFVPGFDMPGEGTVTEMTFLEYVEAHGDSLEIQPGELVVTGSYEFGFAGDYLLPVSEAASDIVEKWDAFQEANSEYYVGQAYPDWIYYLFGGWIRGGTLSQYELPCSYIYYRG